MAEKDGDILQKLRRDHRNMLSMLAVLQAEVDRIAAGEDADFSLLAMIMDYLINYPDIYHHAEETTLFMLVSRHNALLAQSIDRIVIEHKDLGMLSRRLAAAFHNLQHGGGEPRRYIQSLVDDYITRQSDHMRREETVYFPLLEKSLSEDEWRAIHAELRKIEDPLFGDQVRQTYLERHANVMRLAAVRRDPAQQGRT